MGAMPWRELADLPFAAALRAYRGGLGPRGAIVTSAQLAGMAALLAETLGIAVDG